MCVFACVRVCVCACVYGWQLIALMKSAGAKEVHFRVASPPVTDPCFFGMDFPSREELFFNQHKGDLKVSL